MCSVRCPGVHGNPNLGAPNWAQKWWFLMKNGSSRTDPRMIREHLNMSRTSQEHTWTLKNRSFWETWKTENLHVNGRWWTANDPKIHQNRVLTHVKSIVICLLYGAKHSPPSGGHPHPVSPMGNISPETIILTMFSVVMNPRMSKDITNADSVQ